MGTGYEATCSKCTYHEASKKISEMENTAKNGRLFWLITQELYSTRKGSCTAAVNATNFSWTTIFLYMSVKMDSLPNTATGLSGAIMEKIINLLSAILTGARDAAAAW